MSVACTIKASDEGNAVDTTINAAETTVTLEQDASKEETSNESNTEIEVAEPAESITTSTTDTTTEHPDKSDLATQDRVVDEPQETSSSNTKSNEQTGSDSSDGSFVIMLDDESEPTGETEAVHDDADIEVADSDSFLILFDDEESEDRTKIDENVGTYKISLDGDISFHNIVKLKAQLESTFDAIGIELDATGVEGMDTASAQMLLAYTNNLRNSSIPVKWLGTSRTFDNVSETLGMKLID